LNVEMSVCVFTGATHSQSDENTPIVKYALILREREKND
jgi:hypothetical protein